MKKALYLCIALLIAAAVWTGAALAQEDLKELTMGIIPTESSASAMKKRASKRRRRT